MSPFSKDRLNDLLKGREISIVSVKDLQEENPKLRFDSQFQSRESLDAINKIASFDHFRISDLSIAPLKGRSISYSENGDFPVIRSGDISNSFQAGSLLRSSDRESAFYVKKSDVLISSIGQGSIGKIQLFREDGEFATVSEVTVLRVKGYSPACVAAFLSGHYGQAQIHRYVTGATGQLHLYPKDVDRILIPKFTAEFQDRISRLYDRQEVLYRSSITSQARAESKILEALGLVDWSPLEQLSFTGRASDVFDANRIDAQYFRPLFVEVEEKLKATNSAVMLGSVLSLNARGRQPKYSEKGLPVINSKHVRTNRVVLSGNRVAIEKGSPVMIEHGDVLLNGTGEGTLGRAAPYLHSAKALPDNHVTVLRSNLVDSVYLSVFLNSPLGQWQIERHIKGSSGQIELYPNDIDKILIWNAPEALQKSVRREILSAFEETKKASELLLSAERAVDTAIEGGEVAAMNYLDSIEGTT
ncbi:restriction endonuclease subunit S [uncultured Gilvimarinus sp.]|uniref:restriction endonuclease subunit S n=1 Tax=uncultured Gilvimarinus sp. TaxID=1689143 RepID=UPI0030DCDA26